MKHIRIIGPSSHTEPHLLDGGIKLLESRGFKITIAPQVYIQNNQSAGTVQEKLDALHDAFRDKDVDAIMASCGGNGAIHLLPHIDYDLVKSNPKPLFGYSDSTVLLNAIHAKTSIPTHHGPSLSRLNKPFADDQFEQLIDCINGNHTSLAWDKLNIINEGTASGRLIGGNLSAFQTLLGTPYLPSLTEPFILFFEDIGDELSRYDRMLAHLRLSGLFDKAQGILFGDLQGNDTPTRLPFGKTIEQIIADNTNGLNIPIITQCPFGHRDHLWTLPIGTSCSIKVYQGALSAQFN